MGVRSQTKGQANKLDEISIAEATGDYRDAFYEDNNTAEWGEPPVGRKRARLPWRPAGVSLDKVGEFAGA